MPTKYITLNTTGLNIPDIAPLRNSQSDGQLTDQLSTVGTLTSDSPTTNNCQVHVKEWFFFYVYLIHIHDQFFYVKCTPRCLFLYV